MGALNRKCGIGGLLLGLSQAKSMTAIVILGLLSAVRGSGIGDSCDAYVNTTASTFSFPIGNGSNSPINCTLRLNDTPVVYLTFSNLLLNPGDYVVVVDKQGLTVFNSSSVFGETVVAAGANATLQLVANSNYSSNYSLAVRASYSGDCRIQFSNAFSVPLHGYVDPSLPIDCLYSYLANPTYAPLSFTFTDFNITSGYLAFSVVNKTIANYTGVGLQPDVIQPISATLTIRLVVTAGGQSFTGLVAKTSSGCTNTILISGTYSVSYPPSGMDLYDNNLNCRWLVRTANSSYKLMVTVTHLDLASDLDRLVVGDGFSSRSIGSPAIFQHGSAVGTPILMSGDSAILQFLTDEAGSGKGFSVTFTSLAFGGKYMYNGSISLQFAGTDGCSVDPATGSCDSYFLLQAEVNKQIVLHLINETLLYAQSMLVYDGASMQDPLLMRFDTMTALHPVASSSNQMLIVVKNLNNRSMSLVATFERQPAGQSKSSWQSADSVELSALLASQGDMTFWSIQPPTSADVNASTTVRLRVDKLSIPYGMKGAVFAGANRALDFDLVDPVASLPLVLDLPSRQPIWCLFKKNDNFNGTIMSPISFVASYLLVKTTEALAGTTGAVTTPNFPGHYPLGGLYNWTLAVPSAKVVHVYFTDFELASRHQLVAYSVDAGANTTSFSILASWQGSSLPDDFVYKNSKTSNGSLILGFYLDTTLAAFGEPPVAASGFRFHYELLDCGGNITYVSAIQTPGYPSSVNQTLVCLWIIDVPRMADSNGSVNILNYTLTFVGALNETDIQIRDGGSYDSALVSVPVEDRKPVNMLSSRNQLWIKYNFSEQASGANSSRPGAAFGLNYFIQSCNSSDQCDGSLCIHASWRCDGVPHCRDGGDERGCYPGQQPAPAPQQGVAYWVLGVSIGGALLLGVVLAVAAPPLYRRCRYRNYSELRDMMAPVPT